VTPCRDWPTEENLPNRLNDRGSAVGRPRPPIHVHQSPEVSSFKETVTARTTNNEDQPAQKPEEGQIDSSEQQSYVARWRKTGKSPRQPPSSLNTASVLHHGGHPTTTGHLKTGHLSHAKSHFTPTEATRIQAELRQHSDTEKTVKGQNSGGEQHCQVSESLCRCS